MSPDEHSAPRYREPLLGVVFDLDGTLVVSNQNFPKMRKEVIRIAELHGVMPGHLSPREPTARLISAADAELERSGVVEALRHRFLADVHRVIDAIEMEALPTTHARPGAGELLQALEERGYRIGLLTRSCDAFCRAALQRTGLAPHFPFLRTRSAAGPAKPSPDALLLLLHDMGVPPARALFVGDHTMDAECAVGARVRFYGILEETPGPDSITVERFRASGADAVAKNLTDLAQFIGVAVRAPRPTAPPVHP
ncbi:MAG TPA: HAD family hydrolase [Thermoplasmata archaeon]|nr:HAD family hydrolase [Thermoplasmata archaeon]